MVTFLGWPVVTAENCFAVIKDRGIVPWPKIQDPESIEAYLKKATDDQKAEVRQVRSADRSGEASKPSHGRHVQRFPDDLQALRGGFHHRGGQRPGYLRMEARQRQDHHRARGWSPGQSGGRLADAV